LAYSHLEIFSAGAMTRRSATAGKLEISLFAVDIYVFAQA